MTLIPAVAGVTAPARADVIVLEALKDNTLYETPGGELSNGAGDHFFAGRTGQGEGLDRRRGLIAFDVAGGLPAGATVNSVTLTLSMSRTQSLDQTVSLHRVPADWGEGASHAPANEGIGDVSTPGDATWLHTFYDTLFWSTAGGDYDPVPSAAAVVVGMGFYDWTSPAMVADVQGWLDDPATNFGWAVIGNEDTLQTAKRFDSRTHPFVPNRPQLVIDFTPGADVGACCLPGQSCTELTLADCDLQGGNHLGDGTTCDPNPCPPEDGACCLPGGQCQVLTEDACGVQGGAYQGAGVACTPELCALPTGACCLAGAACRVLTAGDCADQGGAYQGDDAPCDPGTCPLQLEPYVDPLPVPSVAQPIIGVAGGAATYQIVMSEFQQQLHRDLPPTTVWGLNGSYPGPTIEARSGQPVTVEWVNDLRDADGNLRIEHYLPVDPCPHGAQNAAKTVVHLHGAHVPWLSDGYPEFTFLPGESDLYHYPNDQFATTLWYHDHSLGITRLNMYMGLSGFYILRDEFEDNLALPDGEFEVPLLIQDRSFNPDGSLQYPATWQDHFFGETILVNGRVWPFMNVKQGKYRFRILNGSNSRTYTLSLSNGMPFFVIGSDGGLLRQPVTLTELTLTSAERADVVIDFAGAAPGTEIILGNSAPAPFPGQAGVGVVPHVMKFTVGVQNGYTAPLPPSLRPAETLDEAAAVAQREFVLEKGTEPCAGTRWLINGLGWDDVTEYPRLDSIEVWSFVNRSGMVHPMHIHLVQFQILDRQPFEIVDDAVVPVGDPIQPEPHEAGWKDTVAVYPFEIARVIARFEDYTGKYAYHCHNVEHEDHEMMRQFVVLPPCPADLNNSGDVNSFDLAIVLGAWGFSPGHPADLNKDGVVGAVDLAELLGAWGLCPGLCSDDSDCDDLDACTGVEACLAGFCTAGAALDCNDGDACTVDTCDAAAGCVYDVVDCDDGDTCTADSCMPARGCVHDPVPCGDLLVNTAVDETDGSCDDGDCSLRDALLLVADGQVIGFDPAVFPPTAPGAIDIGVSQLPALAKDNVTIDASNAGVIVEDTDGSLGNNTHGLTITGNGNTVRGLQIRGFDGSANSAGVRISGGGGNTVGGIYDPAAANQLGQGCLLSDNGVGVFIAGGATANTVRGCLIGTDLTGTVAVGNINYGVEIEGAASANVIGGDRDAGLGNVISDSGSSGISIAGTGSDANVVLGNTIGLDLSGSANLGNGANGIEIFGGAQATVIGSPTPGEGNRIAYNGGAGITLFSPNSDFNTWRNNIIFDNFGIAIDIVAAGGNDGIPVPIIDAVSTTQVSGSGARAGAAVDVYTNVDGDSDCLVFVGQALADGAGTWVLGGLTLTAGEYVVAVQTDADGNSSEVSAAVVVEE